MEYCYGDRHSTALQIKKFRKNVSFLGLALDVHAI